MGRGDHFVTCSYLHNFIDPNTTLLKNPSLWVFNRNPETPIKSRSPENICTDKHCDDYISSDGTVSKANFNQEIENNAIRALAKILQEISINKEERLDFSRFIMLSWIRVPQFQSLLETNPEDLEEHEKKLSTCDHEYYKRIIQHHFYKDYTNSIEITNLNEVIGWIKNHPLYTIKTLHRKHADSTLRVSKYLADILYNMSWIILEAPEGSYFVTSDNPVFNYDPFEKEEYYIYRINSPTVQFYFPLSPKFCLFAFYEDFDIMYSEATERQVAEINSRIVYNSDEYIFSHDKSFSIIKHLLIYFAQNGKLNLSK